MLRVSCLRNRADIAFTEEQGQIHRGGEGGRLSCRGFQGARAGDSPDGTKPSPETPSQDDSDTGGESDDPASPSPRT
jgi:hypothetical protein